MTGDESPQGVRHYLGRIHNTLKALIPHVTWVLGLGMVVDGVYDLGWTEFLSQYPRVALFWMGLLLLFSGREAVGYRKKWRKAKRRAERFKEDYEEVTDAYVGQSI